MSKSNGVPANGSVGNVTVIHSRAVQYLLTKLRDKSTDGRVI